jgi:hypothetical protein
MTIPSELWPGSMPIARTKQLSHQNLNALKRRPPHSFDMVFNLMNGLFYYCAAATKEKQKKLFIDSHSRVARFVLVQSTNTGKTY